MTAAAEGATVHTRRTGGLLGGAPRSRALHPRYNHAWLYAENKIDRLDVLDYGRPLVVQYEILGPDTSQRDVYACRHLGRDCVRNVVLAPDMRKMPGEELVRVGEWRFFPGSHDVSPHSPDSYVCLNGVQEHCLRESTFAPCVRCHGSTGPDHFLVCRTYGESGRPSISAGGRAPPPSVFMVQGDDCTDDIPTWLSEAETAILSSAVSTTPCHLAPLCRKGWRAHSHWQRGGEYPYYGRRSITLLELGLAKARRDCVNGDGASSSTTPPSSTILPGEGETFDSRPATPQPQSPSYSPVASDDEASDNETPLSTYDHALQLTANDETSILIYERALQLTKTAERLLQEILPFTAPSFNTIFNWTEFFLLGDHSLKGVDVHAIERIVEHFLLIVPIESETPPGSSTEHGHDQAELVE